jgi:hypothetical protein
MPENLVWNVRRSRSAHTAVIGPVVLFFVPKIVDVTFTEKVHEPLAGASVRNAAARLIHGPLLMDDALPITVTVVDFQAN